MTEIPIWAQNIRYKKKKKRKRSISIYEGNRRWETILVLRGKELHKGKWENVLLSVLYFRSDIWKVSEDLSEVDRQWKGGRSHPGGLGESDQRE